MSRYLSVTGVMPLLPGFMQLRYAENTGMAFGLLKNSTWLLSVLTFLVILVLLYVVVSKRSSSKLFNMSIVFIVSGGLGNLYDRIMNGFVVDYLEFAFVDFAIFNFADVLINVGAAMLFIYFIFFDRDFWPPKKKNELSAEREADEDDG